MPAFPTRFSAVTVSRVALVNLIVNGLIVVTGGAVRLTGSGLGCPTWPRCTSGSLVPTAKLGIYGVIEFSNRTLNGLLGVVALAVLVAVFRSTRRDLRSWALVSFLGIPAQALLGGISVLTKLNPWVVGCHFLLSSVLVAVATLLWLRSREPGVGQLIVRRPLVQLVHGVALATAAVLVVGTVVTGSGPHAAAAEERLGRDAEEGDQGPRPQVPPGGPDDRDEDREGHHTEEAVERPVAELDHAVDAELAGGHQAAARAPGPGRAAEPGSREPHRAAGHDDEPVDDQVDQRDAGDGGCGEARGKDRHVRRC